MKMEKGEMEDKRTKPGGKMQPTGEEDKELVLATHFHRHSLDVNYMD